MATQRTCTKCGETKPLDDFYLKTRQPSRHETDCKRCDNRARNTRSRKPPKPAAGPLPTAAELARWYHAGCHIA